jgi:hypothetical protein
MFIRIRPENIHIKKFNKIELLSTELHIAPVPPLISESTLCEMKEEILTEALSVSSSPLPETGRNTIHNHAFLKSSKAPRLYMMSGRSGSENIVSRSRFPSCYKFGT